MQRRGLVENCIWGWVLSQGFREDGSGLDSWSGILRVAKAFSLTLMSCPWGLPDHLHDVNPYVKGP